MRWPPPALHVLTCIRSLAQRLGCRLCAAQYACQCEQLAEELPEHILQMCIGGCRETG